MYKKLILILFLVFSNYIFSQKKRIEYYSYGQDGMENVYGVKDSMLIYNNFRSRPTIRKEVADTISRKYHSLKNGIYDFTISSAKVTGRIEIVRKDKLILLNFYYIKVEYSDFIEIYQDPKKQAIKKKKKK